MRKNIFPFVFSFPKYEHFKSFTNHNDFEQVRKTIFAFQLILQINDQQLGFQKLLV